MKIISKLLNVLKLVDDEMCVYFKNGVLQKFTPTECTSYYSTRYLISDGIKYDLENELEIKSIKIPKFKNVDLMDEYGVTGILDYVMRMKAGHLRDSGKKELSIICLRKATELMISSPISWQENDYLRIVRWLIEDGRFDEAEKEEKFLKAELPLVFDRKKMNRHLFNKNLEFSKDFNTDLVEASHHFSCSSEEAKYRGRIFSVTGKDKRFPRLSQEILDCGLSFHPFIFGISTLSACRKGEEIKYSSRPFIDDRASEEIKNHEEYIDKINRDKQRDLDRKEYYRVVHTLPDIAPKSFSAYTRMKNAKSDNFLKVVVKVKEVGIEIE